MLFHCEESSTTKTASFRRNPPGARGFGQQALSFVGYDDKHRALLSFAPGNPKTLARDPTGSATGSYAFSISGRSRPASRRRT